MHSLNYSVKSSMLFVRWSLMRVLCLVHYFSYPLLEIYAFMWYHNIGSIDAISSNKVEDHPSPHGGGSEKNLARFLSGSLIYTKIIL